ncbi:MAG: lytic transglycosylase domain-containing protein [SAR324 cluster bacterium]|nr:lytic transglycosylase domain-containing protein [SAR324 cluster bacterium]
MERFMVYRDMIRQVFAEEDLPVFLMALPALESGFRADAISSAGAGGLWQFMPQTGTTFGLKSDEWVDERFDPVKSTRAAAKYLKKLYAQFQDWHQALTAYNAGEGRVQKALTTEQKHTMPAGYWKLELKAESRDYYPKFMALVQIFLDKDRAGFEEVRFEPENALASLNVPVLLSLEDVARRLNVPYTEIREFNSYLKQGKPAPGQTEYTLYLRKGQQTQLLESLNKNPPLPAPAFTEKTTARL